MVTSRQIEAADLNLLELSLSKDEYHQTTPVEFFVQPGTVTNVFEDDDGPVFFIRGSNALRVDIQFVDNNDKRRNVVALIRAMQDVTEKAKANGYSEIIFNSNSPKLIAFCKRFGFQESNGELRKLL